MSILTKQVAYLRDMMQWNAKAQRSGHIPVRMQI